MRLEIYQQNCARPPSVRGSADALSPLTCGIIPRPACRRPSVSALLCMLLLWAGIGAGALGGVIVLPGRAHAEGKPSVLVLRMTGLPDSILRGAQGTLTTAAEVLSTDAYERAAQEQATRPDSRFALKEIATRQGADVILVLGMRGRRVLRATFRDGRSAGRVRQIDFRLRGTALPRNVRLKLLDELGQTVEKIEIADAEAPAEDGSDDEPVDDEELEAEDDLVSDEEVGSNFALRVGVGAGFGSRSISIPAATGPVRLATNLFPAARVVLRADYVSSGRRTFSFGVHGSFYTSLGLQSEEQRPDNTSRTVGSRSQSLQTGAHVQFRVGKSDRAPRFEIGSGMGLRTFGTRQELTVPNSNLLAPYIRTGVIFNLGSSALTIGIVPEFAMLTNVGGELEALGVGSLGYTAGGHFFVSYQVLSWLDLDFTYRESHGFIGTNVDGQYHDIERFGIVSASYVF